MINEEKFEFMKELGINIEKWHDQYTTGCGFNGCRGCIHCSLFHRFEKISNPDFAEIKRIDKRIIRILVGLKD